MRYAPIRHAIGVDISDVSVEVLELSGGPKGRPRVRAWSHVELRQGTIQDGEILDSAELARALAAAFRTAKPQPFSTRKAVVSLPESRVYLRAFEFPKRLSHDQVRRAVSYEAESVLPLTLDEVYHDALFHQSRVDTHHILFAAAPRRIIDAYLAALHVGGLVLVAFDVESAALARSIVGFHAEPVLVADIGGRATVMSVVERAEVHSAVTLPVAGDLCTERIAQALAISPTDAESRKRRDGLRPNADPALRRSIADSFQPLVDELRRTAQYHEFHTGRTVRTLLLAGGSARLPGLVEHMAAETGLKVSIGDPWATPQVEFPDTLSSADRVTLEATRGAFATVVGLALRGIAREPAAAGINLLPEFIKMPYIQWRVALAASALAMGAALVTLTLAILLGLKISQYWVQASHIAPSAARVRTLIESPRYQAALQDTREISQELSTLRAFHDQVPDVSSIVSEIRRAIPSGITLQDLEVQGAPVKAAPVTVKLAGRADRRETFLAFESQLRALPTLRTLGSPLTNLNVREQTPFVVTLTFDPSNP